MSAKKPRFKPRVGWAVDKSLLGGGWIAAKKRLTAATHSVRVTDTRDLTAEQAVQKVLQRIYAVHDSQSFLELLAALVDMKVDLDGNGKVRVRRLRQ